MNRVTAYDDTKPSRPKAEAKQPMKFMSRADVARYMGLKSVRSLSGVELPEHDVEVGIHKGYSEETIDKFIEERPGRGRWGARGSAAQ